jgi:hypothetical protein
VAYTVLNLLSISSTIKRSTARLILMHNISQLKWVNEKFEKSSRYTHTSSDSSMHASDHPISDVLLMRFVLNDKRFIVQVVHLNLSMHLKPQPAIQDGPNKSKIPLAWLRGMRDNHTVLNSAQF